MHVGYWQRTLLWSWFCMVLRWFHATGQGFKILQDVPGIYGELYALRSSNMAAGFSDVSLLLDSFERFWGYCTRNPYQPGISCVIVEHIRWCGNRSQRVCFDSIGEPHNIGEWNVSLGFKIRRHLWSLTFSLISGSMILNRDSHHWGDFSTWQASLWYNSTIESQKQSYFCFFGQTEGAIAHFDTLLTSSTVLLRFVSNTFAHNNVATRHLLSILPMSQ